MISEQTTITNPATKPKRCCWIRSRVKPRFKEEVRAVAESCGMDESEFVVARSFGFNPRLRLSNEESMLLDILIKCRNDLDNFAKAFKKADVTVRKRIIQVLGETKMKRWLAANAAVSSSCRQFISEVCSSDEIPNNGVVCFKYSCGQTFDYDKAVRESTESNDISVAISSKQRDPEIKARVTRQQKAQIMILCAKLGINETGLLRSRCICYIPKPRLNERQKEGLRRLEDARDLIRMFAEKKRMMSAQEQEHIFSNYASMLTWLTAVDKVSSACKVFLKEYVGIKRTRGTEVKHQE